MPKRTNLLPNQRVDIEDLDNALHTYPRSLQNLQAKEANIDSIMRVMSGFRVEVADQGTSPRQITVYNGYAIRRDGQALTNEDAANTARTITLPANGTYYLEVEYTTSESDVDARAFWDPSYDNGADPSGDLLPDGREFSQNVSTRVQEDWQVVEPVSTSGFEIDSNPSSERIPIAKIFVDNSIVDPTVVTSPARTTLLRPATASGGSTELYVVNSRLFGSTGDIIIGLGTANQETKGFTANNRENNTLTIPSLDNNHPVGVRIVDNAGTPAQFVDARTSQVPVIATAIGDARPGFFQANEESGYALGQDESATTGSADTQIEDLKQYVDFLSAQIRELKFGSALDVDVGSIAPPTSYPNPPRYFDFAGSAAGGRTNSISIGTGTTSWGDFNVAQNTDFPTTLTAALAALPAAGGRIFLKAGTYTITGTSPTITKAVTIIGEGQGVTIINATTTAHALTIEADTYLEGLSITRDTGATVLQAIDHNAATTKLSARHCTIHGAISTSNYAMDSCEFELCDFVSDTGSSLTSFAATVTNGVFRRCLFDAQVDTSTSLACSLGTGSANVSFENCTFQVPANASYVVDLETGVNHVMYRQCAFLGAGAATGVCFFSGCDHVSVVGCEMTTAKGLDLSNCDYLIVSDCDIEYSGDNSGVRLTGSCRWGSISSCRVHQTSVNTNNGTGIEFVFGIQNFSVTDCLFTDCDRGIEITALASSVIKGCHFTAPTAGRGIHGIAVPASGTWSITDVNISDCIIDDLSENLAVSGGIYFANSTDSTISDVNITGCIIKSLNSAVGCYGIAIDPGNNTAFRIGISNCSIYDVEGTFGGSGIYLDKCDAVVIENCRLANIGDTVASGLWSGIGINEFQGLSIRGCTFADMGMSTTSSSDPAAIRLGTDTLTAAKDAVVTGNTFKRIQANIGDFAVILILGAAGRCVVSDNTMELDGNGMTFAAGVKVKAGGAGNVKNITVSNNQISVVSGGEYAYGVNVTVTPSAEFQEGNVSITGNVINEFTTTGIHLSAPTGATLFSHGWLINNNVLESSVSGCQGIYCNSLSSFSVANNLVTLTNSGADEGIFATTFGSADDRLTGVFSANVIRSSSTAGDGLDVAGQQRANVVGNVVLMDPGSSGAAINTGDEAFVVGNYAKNDGGGTDIALSGTGGQSKAYSDADGSSPPSGTSDVGLNRRPG